MMYIYIRQENILECIESAFMLAVNISAITMSKIRHIQLACMAFRQFTVYFIMSLSKQIVLQGTICKKSCIVRNYFHNNIVYILY